MPRLKTTSFWEGGIFNDQDNTQHFVSTLQQTPSSVQDLPWIRYIIGAAAYASIKRSLMRNQQLNRVAV
jgi:hypothetical protein